MTSINLHPTPPEDTPCAPVTQALLKPPALPSERPLSVGEFFGKLAFAGAALGALLGGFIGFMGAQFGDVASRDLGLLVVVATSAFAHAFRGLVVRR